MLDKIRRGFAPQRRRKYLKWHITAMPEAQRNSGGRRHAGQDAGLPGPGDGTLKHEKVGDALSRCRNANRGYDLDDLCRRVSGMGRVA